MKNRQKNERKKNGKNRSKLAYDILVLFLLAAASIVFEILTIRLVREGFVERNAPWLIAVAITLTVVLLGSGITTRILEKEKLFKLVFSAFFLVLFFLVVLFVVVKTDFILILQSPELLQKFLERTGAWMPILYILLQFLQVILLPIPSVVSTLAGVALFGPLKTTVYSLIGILLGSFAGFFIGRKLGYKAVAWLVGEEELNEWLKKVKGKDNLILTLMFVLPLFPDDVLCFIAGLSTMSTKYFSVMIVISRLISVSTTCFSFELIPFNTWWGLLIWAAIFIVVIVAFLIVYKNIDKINERLKKRRDVKNSKK